MNSMEARALQDLEQDGGFFVDGASFDDEAPKQISVEQLRSGRPRSRSRIVERMGLRRKKGHFRLLQDGGHKSG